MEIGTISCMQGYQKLLGYKQLCNWTCQQLMLSLWLAYLQIMISAEKKAKIGQCATEHVCMECFSTY